MRLRSTLLARVSWFEWSAGLPAGLVLSVTRNEVPWVGGPGEQPLRKTKVSVATIEAAKVNPRIARVRRDGKSSTCLIRNCDKSGPCEKKPDLFRHLLSHRSGSPIVSCALASAPLLTRHAFYWPRPRKAPTPAQAGGVPGGRRAADSSGRAAVLFAAAGRAHFAWRPQQD